MDRCYFAKEAPDIEVRGDLIFITPSSGHGEIALSSATLASFVVKANRVLDEIYERRSAAIVSIRH